MYNVPSSPLLQKCEDKFGSSFLALVRLRFVTFEGIKDTMGLLLSIVPMPNSKYIRPYVCNSHAANVSQAPWQPLNLGEGGEKADSFQLRDYQEKG